MGVRFGRKEAKCFLLKPTVKVLLMRELWGNSLWESRETCHEVVSQAFACAASAGASAEATAAEREGPPDEDDTVWNVDADEEFGASAPRRAYLSIVLANGRGDAGHLVDSPSRFSAIREPCFFL